MNARLFFTKTIFEKINLNDRGELSLNPGLKTYDPNQTSAIIVEQEPNRILVVKDF